MKVAVKFSSPYFSAVAANTSRARDIMGTRWPKDSHISMPRRTSLKARLTVNTGCSKSSSKVPEAVFLNWKEKAPELEICSMNCSLGMLASLASLML